MFAVAMLASSAGCGSGSDIFSDDEWKLVGHWLHDHAAGASVATVPVGAIGYFSGLDVIDLVGLTSREVAKGGRSIPPQLLFVGWIGHERENTRWVLAERPSLIVMNRWRDRPWQDNV